MLSFFPRGVLDEILNLIESVSEGFPSYSSIMWAQDLVILDQSDLQGDVLEDIYQLRDFSGITGNNEPPICYFEMLERKDVCNV